MYEMIFVLHLIKWQHSTNVRDNQTKYLWWNVDDIHSSKATKISAAFRRVNEL